MKTIKLNKGHIVLVDDEDYDFLLRFSWHVTGTNELLYARSSYKMLMHKMLLGSANSYLIDHIDGNGLNNQKENLRFCTSLQNNQNRRKIKPKLSKYKGVTYRKDSGKWRARIRYKGRLINLGNYHTERLAAYHYNFAAKKFFGMFAKINIL